MVTNDYQSGHFGYNVESKMTAGYFIEKGKNTMNDGRITSKRVVALASRVADILGDYRYAQDTERSLYERLAGVGLHDSDDIRRGVHRQMLVDGVYPSPIDTADVLQECLQTLGDLCPDVMDMVHDLHPALYADLGPAREGPKKAPVRRVRKDAFFRRLGNTAGNVVIIRREESKGAQPAETLFADRGACAQKFIATYGPDSGRYGGIRVEMLPAAPRETYRVTYDYGKAVTFDVIILEGTDLAESGGAE